MWAIDAIAGESVRYGRTESKSGHNAQKEPAQERSDAGFVTSVAFTGR